MTQRTPAQLRADAEAKLSGPGSRRIQLQSDLDTVDQELLPLVAEARAMEVPIRRITELTGLAPNTIRAWMAKKPE
ncbi:hypothetical protein ACFWXO_36755 [Kitasatospora sp. NPDC059088]|uniref:hypothetical protein n=1 Tax=Kitasatospora sp. NPDC059088 TaxID=3346722 RepID=UPI0036785D54